MDTDMPTVPAHKLGGDPQIKKSNHDIRITNQVGLKNAWKRLCYSTKILFLLVINHTMLIYRGYDVMKTVPIKVCVLQ